MSLPHDGDFSHDNVITQTHTVIEFPEYPYFRNCKNQPYVPNSDPLDHLFFIHAEQDGWYYFLKSGL